MLRDGEILNGMYQIEYQIGSGGTGDVYRAYHLRLQKEVVVKKIKGNFVGHINARAEVDILKCLKHTYLPQVYDFVQMGGTIYTVMDYIEGCDLEEYINQGCIVDEETVIKWLRQLCEVLGYLHSQTPSIIHSDIKPANIMITNSGDVCLIDFNISFGADDAEQISGISLPYASPEQLEKARLFMSRLHHSSLILDGRTDMYSLAASFYALLSGMKPANPDQCSTPLSSYELPYSDGLLHIIDKAMSFDRDYRYANMDDMLSAVNSMYKHTRKYKMYLLGVIFSSMLYVSAMGFGAWCIVRGQELNINDAYEKDYKTFVNYYQSCEYDSAIDKGYDILNDSDYKDKLKTKSRKIEILHIIGECYFENEDYEEAKNYYGKAINLISDYKDYPDYYRDYVISLIRCSQINEAQQMIEQLKNQGISMTELDILDAEICAYNKSYKEAIKKIEKLAQLQIDDETIRHLLVLGAECSEKIEDYEKEIELYEKARSLDNTTTILRKLGNAYYLIAKNGKLNTASSKTYIKKAEECYGELVNRSYASKNDFLNLAICKRILGDYDESIRILVKLDEQEHDYRIYMHLAFAYDKKGDVNKTESNMKKAINVYKQTAVGDREPESSDNMQNLYELQKKYR